MNLSTLTPERLSELCATLNPMAGMEQLQQRLNQLGSGLEFEHALSRGGWHRLGGVVDAAYQRVSNNIAQWVEQQGEDDVEELLLRYIDSGYFVTRLAGKTHFFTMPSGNKAEAFYQIEIEELQEVLERPLVDRDWFPETLAEFIDPLEYPRLVEEPIGTAYYYFRRVTAISELMAQMTQEYASSSSVPRFLRDWNRSSAANGTHFCRHWVLALREYKDREGECRLSAKPVSVFSGELPSLPQRENISGVELANALHEYDRALGYPFAWFFIMLSRKSANYTLAQAVLRDQMGAYDYLPQKDFEVLAEWEKQPYGV